MVRFLERSAFTERGVHPKITAGQNGSGPGMWVWVPGWHGVTFCWSERYRGVIFGPYAPPCGVRWRDSER